MDPEEAAEACGGERELQLHDETADPGFYDHEFIGFVPAKPDGSFDEDLEARVVYLLEGQQLAYGTKEAW